MQLNLRIAIWNANGLSNHKNEIEIFLKTNFIDIFLISESHFTSKSYFKISNYDLVTANHPSNKAHAGAAVLVKSSIKYEILQSTTVPYLQAAGIKVKCGNTSINLFAIYFPPRHSVKCPQYENFFKNLGEKFIVGGDFNAKHPWWGSRLTNPKGTELYKCIQKNNYSALSTGSPTYWPGDVMKIPDLLDFFVYKGVHRSDLDIMHTQDLSSDHNPIILTHRASVETIAKKYKMITAKTNLNAYTDFVDRNLNLKVPIKNNEQLEDAIESFINLIHEAATSSTSEYTGSASGSNVRITAELQKLIVEKRRLRRNYQQTRSIADKRIFNRACRYVKIRLDKFKNDLQGEFFQHLDARRNDEYSLWNATKYIKRPTKRNVPIRNNAGLWIRSDSAKAETFKIHLEHTFQPLALVDPTDKMTIEHFLDVACQLDKPIKHITPSEVTLAIKKLNNSKSPGYDCVDSNALKCLPKKGLLFLTIIFNGILRLSHFPSQWKYAKIIMIPKPNKPENLVTSYRPISLLSVISKVFERLFLKRLLPVLEKHHIVPDHQFGFRHKHGTPEQCHRIVETISNALERKQYCSAVFLDVQQAFDKVWHEGLLFKLKILLPAPFYILLKSYLTDRLFYVNANDEDSNFAKINAGIPQGSVLGPVLYTIFTSDMPTTSNVLVATYADDTAIIASNDCQILASRDVQDELDLLQDWFKKWNIKINSDKSTQVTFTLRKHDCPRLKLNGVDIPVSSSVKYLGLHLDRRLTWQEHIKKKRDQLNIKTKKMYWLLGRQSQLSMANKLILYKVILKPVWTYGIQLWGTASESNIKILQRYQSKTIRSIINAPWYITNVNIHKDLEMPTVKEEIKKFSERYLQRLSNHSNILAINLLDDSEELQRLKRFHVLDLPFRN